MPILVTVLAFSVGLNVCIYYFDQVRIREMQGMISKTRAKAFNQWVGSMELVINSITGAETYLDVQRARQYFGMKSDCVSVLTLGLLDASAPHSQEDDLYWKISSVTFYLHEALESAEYPPRAEPIDDYLKAAIGSLNSTIQNLLSKTAYVVAEIEVDPAQQLKNAGVLTDVINILGQIDQISGDIITHYGL